MTDLLDHDKLVGLHAAPDAVVGAGIGIGLPRDQPGLPARRDRQADHRAHARHVLRRRGRRTARRRLPHRHRPGTRRAGRPRDPADRPRCSAADDIDPTRSRCARWRTRCSRADFSSRQDWRRAEIPAAGGHGNARAVATIHTPTACGGTANGVTPAVAGGRRPHLRRAGRAASTSSWPPNSSWAWATACRSRCCRSPTSAPRSGAAGAARWRSSTSTPSMSFSYVMNKMGEGTVGDLRGMSLLIAAYGVH